MWLFLVCIGLHTMKVHSAYLLKTSFKYLRTCFIEFLLSYQLIQFLSITRLRTVECTGWVRGGALSLQSECIFQDD